MDLSLDRSSGSSASKQLLLRRILACRQDSMRLRNKMDSLHGRICEADKDLEEIKSEVKKSDRKLSECIRDKWNMTRKCTEMKKDLEKALGAQEIQKLLGTFESLMIENKDPGGQSTDTVSQVECLPKKRKGTGMNLKLPELQVKVRPEGSKSRTERE